MVLLRRVIWVVWLWPMLALGQSKGSFDIIESSVTSFQSVNTMSKVARSGDSHVIVGWRSVRQGGFYHNIYIQKLDEAGEPQWEQDGVPICPFPANQTEFGLIEDGYGGIVVVWEDYRLGADLPVLFAQRINLRGEPLWGKEGVRICDMNGPQRKPQVISDLNKGFYIVWEDYRRGYDEADIYTQYVDLGGKPKWLANGLPVATAPNMQKNVSIACDENHYLFLLWEDFRNGVYWNLYAQKLDPEGNFYWKAGGMDVFAGVEENHQNPAMVPDGYGGLLFVYQKYSSETNGTDIYRGRLNAAGEVVFHFATCFSKDEQLNPKIVKKGSKALLCWEDRRNGNWDLYAQMVRLKDGLLEWGINGVPVAMTPGEERNPVVITSVSYGYQVFSWLQKDGPVTRMAVQRLDNLGQPAWEMAGKPVCTMSNDQTEPSILPDENGGIWCSWTDRRLMGSAYIYAQHLNGQGREMLTPGGVKMASEQTRPYAKVMGLKILGTKAGDFFVVWEDYRNGEKNSDIYLQKLNGDGKSLWRNGGIPVCIAKGDQNRPLLLEDGVGGLIVAWIDRRNGRDDNIYAQRINAFGKALWQDDGMVVCDAPGDQSGIRAVTDGKEGVVMCWVDARSVVETGFDLFIQRLSHDGEPLWQLGGKPFARFAGLQTSPSLAEDGNGGAYIAWMDSRNETSNIYVQHMNEFGLPEWENGGRQLAASQVNQRQPEIVRNFENDLYVVWQDGRHGDGYEKLFMQCIDPSGFKLWAAGGVHTCDYPGRQSKPSILGDATGNFWVTWLDERERRSLGVQLLAQKFTIGGDPQWRPDGVIIGESMEEWNDYVVALNKTGYLYLAWSQGVGKGEKHVFFQKLHPDGTKKFDYSGVSVGEPGSDQNSPVIAVNGEGKAIVAWIQQNLETKKYSIKGKKIGE